MGKSRLWPPADVVQFLEFLVIHQATAHVPYPYTVVDAQPWACGCCEDMRAIWAPLANTCVTRLDGAYLVVVLLEIIDVHLPG